MSSIDHIIAECQKEKQAQPIELGADAKVVTDGPRWEDARGDIRAQLNAVRDRMIADLSMGDRKAYEAENAARECIHREATRANRLKVLQVSPHIFLGILNAFQGDYSICALPENGNIPQGAKVVNVFMDNWDRCFNLVISHPSWDIVEPGQRLPTVDGGEWRTYRRDDEGRLVLDK